MSGNLSRDLASTSKTGDGGGIELALAGAFFGFVGYMLDRQFGTLPVFLLVGFLFGFIGSSISFYYRYKAQMAKYDDPEDGGI